MKYNKFGPKSEKSQEIKVTFQEASFLPKIEENLEEDPINNDIQLVSNEKKLMTTQIDNEIFDLEKSKNLPTPSLPLSLKTHPKVSKWNVLLLVRRWVSHMKNLIFHQINLKSLTSYHYKIFQEEVPAASLEEKLKKRSIIISSFSRTIRKISECVPLISPYNKMKLIWDFLIMIITLGHFFLIVFVISFPHDAFDAFYHRWLIFLFIVLLCDIAIKLNSGFFYKGNSIIIRKQIFEKYCKSDLVYDILSLLVIMIYLAVDGLSDHEEIFHFLQLVYFLKFPIFNRLIQNFEEIMNFEEKFEACIDLLKLFVKLLFFAHLVACVWYYLGNLSTLQGNTWLTSSSSFEEKSLSYYYLISLYWSITTISTTGYGDITPKNEYEYFFSLIIMILGSIYFGYSLNYMGFVFSKFSKDGETKKENLCVLNKFMKKNKINFQTQIKIKNYMNFLWENEIKQTTKAESEIFNKLTPNLKKAFLSQTLGKFLLSIPLFTKNFSEDFLQELLFIMKPVNFEPNSFIYQKGDEENLAIYILNEGEVAESFSSKHGEVIVQRFKKGEYFGENEFFTKQKRAFNVKSLTYSTAFLIDFNEFIRILKEYKEDFEQYHLIKDHLLLSSDSSYLYQSCQSCNKNSHILSNCPMLSPLISRTHLINKENSSTPQNREVFARTRSQKINSRKKIYTIQKSQFLFIIHNESNDGNLENKIDSLNKIQSDTLDSNELSPLLRNSHKTDSKEIENENFLNKQHSQTNIKTMSFPNNELNESSIAEKNEEDEHSPELLKNRINDEEKKTHKLISEENKENNVKNTLSSIDPTQLNLKNNVEVNVSQINNKEIKDFETMRLFKKYQPNFNYNVIIMLLNNEFYYRKARKSKGKRKNRKKINFHSKNLSSGRSKKSSLFSRSIQTKRK